jgi:hypothetical protein
LAGKFGISSRPKLWLNLAVKNLGFALMLLLSLVGSENAFAQRNAHELKPMPMRLSPPDPNAPRWHTIKVAPKPGLPEIHFYDKLNPVWWFGNADEPVPPNWYMPDDDHRKTKWYFRNPLHNFTFYVIGIADKKSARSGRYPDVVTNPNGGWNFAISRRRIIFLPFISYERRKFEFYLGWHARGNFGAKINFHDKLKPKPKKPDESDFSTSDQFDR